LLPAPLHGVLKKAFKKHLEQREKEKGEQSLGQFSFIQLCYAMSPTTT